MIRRRTHLKRTPIRQKRRFPSAGDLELGRSRLVVKDRARGWCEVRGPRCADRGHHAHHRLMRSHGGSNEPGNLLWVCAPCHEHVHQYPAVAYERGWLIRSGGTP